MFSDRDIKKHERACSQYISLFGLEKPKKRNFPKKKKIEGNKIEENEIEEIEENEIKENEIEENEIEENEIEEIEENEIEEKQIEENNVEENEIEEINDFILMPMQEGLKMGEIRFPKENIFRPKQEILKTFGYRPDSQEQLMELAER